jgi:hypothetical protein
MDNPETQKTQQRLTKKEAIKNGQSRDPDNTEQRLTKKRGNQEWTIQRPRNHRTKTN